MNVMEYPKSKLDAVSDSLPFSIEGRRLGKRKPRKDVGSPKVVICYRVKPLMSLISVLSDRIL